MLFCSINCVCVFVIYGLHLFVLFYYMYSLCFTAGFLLFLRCGVCVCVCVCVCVLMVYWNHCVRVSRFCPDNIFTTAQSFITEFEMVVHHNKLECYAKRLVCYLQNRTYSEGSYKNNYDCTVFWAADPLAIKLSSMVFKVKVTAKFQNFIECLEVLKFLYHWSLCN